MLHIRHQGMCIPGAVPMMERWEGIFEMHKEN